ncbi:Fc.00g081230.m01.CDS01 [Cosmosporella sp. VM-42]
MHGVRPLETAEDIVTHVIQVDDDPSMNPWTFRMFFVGIGLSTFGAVLQETMYFKPQVVYVSVMFLTVLAEKLGVAMSNFIPRKGKIGQFLNPHPWNRKEHTAAKLWYGGYPNIAAGIFITLSSQLIGYGITGMMRNILVCPTKMLYPSNLPITTVIETLHEPKSVTKKRFQIFWIVFVAIFCWERFPENYIASFGSPRWIPLQTLFNSFAGYLGDIILSMALYYGNIWRSKDFPFMSQLLYDPSSNATNSIAYKETSIMNPDFTVNSTMVEEVGVPYLTATYMNYLITSNAGLTATFVHMLLWNYAEDSLGWTWITMQRLKRLLDLCTLCILELTRPPY